MAADPANSAIVESQMEIPAGLTQCGVCGVLTQYRVKLLHDLSCQCWVTWVGFFEHLYLCVSFVALTVFLPSPSPSYKNEVGATMYKALQQGEETHGPSC